MPLQGMIYLYELLYFAECVPLSLLGFSVRAVPIVLDDDRVEALT